MVPVDVARKASIRQSHKLRLEAGVVTSWVEHAVQNWLLAGTVP